MSELDRLIDATAAELQRLLRLSCRDEQDSVFLAALSAWLAQRDQRFDPDNCQDSNWDHKGDE
jgi:hypothetical protein